MVAVRCALQVKFGQLGVGDKAFTYGVKFWPNEPPPDLTQAYLIPDKKLPENCSWYLVRCLACTQPWLRQHAAVIGVDAAVDTDHVCI